ncbi:hypothetical protein PR202_ga03689 [Eleusine coracana subsp. coracana]|uniref:Uncharacterized protein n=1 Tax=Eleusine coracana subsp. coracana TaxID=191504 RepID=A0AAV5BP39_ELECO|nr:hypothetical protein PR202_ga03689 [Eleusine coracana subsp. coracana]
MDWSTWKSARCVIRKRNPLIIFSFRASSRANFGSCFYGKTDCSSLCHNRSLLVSWIGGKWQVIQQGDSLIEGSTLLLFWVPRSFGIIGIGVFFMAFPLALLLPLCRLVRKGTFGSWLEQKVYPF